MKRLPWHGPCFTCGQEDGAADGVRYFVEDDGSIRAEATFTLRCQGAPGHAHGGSLTSVMDEAMGWAVWNAGHRALAAKLEIDFRLPTPLAVPLVVRARIVGKGQRSIRTSAEMLLPDGRVSAEAKGVFVDLKERWDTTIGANWGESPGA